MVQVDQEKGINEALSWENLSTLRVWCSCKDIRADQGVASETRIGAEKIFEKAVYSKSDRDIEKCKEQSVQRDEVSKFSIDGICHANACQGSHILHI